MRINQIFPRRWPELQRFLTAPIIAAMAVVVCAWLAASRGIALLPGPELVGLFCAWAAGGALAASMISAGPRVPAALLISAGSTVSTGYLLSRVAQVAAGGGNAAAAEVIRSWLWFVVPGVLTVCFALAWGGFVIRDSLQRIGQGRASGPKSHDR